MLKAIALINKILNIIDMKNKEKKYTKEQVNKKYFGKYIEIYKQYDYIEQKYYYTILKVWGETIHENSTLGQDVGTELEYRR